MIDDSDLQMPNGRSVRNRGFATTRWSIIQQAQQEDSSSANHALQELCKTYWFPLYSYVRTHGHDANAAADITQAFFADLLEREDLKKVDPKLGKFRYFLLAAISNFIKNQHNRENALKRGGGKNVLSLDFRDADSRYGLEPYHVSDPDSQFQKEWAKALLSEVQNRLRTEFLEKGKAHQFELLRHFLAGKNPDCTLAVAAEKLGISEIAVKVAIHRMRGRFGVILREEISQTVSSPDEIDGEIQQLFEILKK